VPDLESPSALPSAPSQASLTLPLHQGASTALLAVCDLRIKARLQSLTLSQAYALLLAVPYKPSSQLEPAEFRQATRYRFGIADNNEEQVGPVYRKCGRPQDPQEAGFAYGDHSSQCHCGDSCTATMTASRWSSPRLFVRVATALSSSRPISSQAA
jgi:hypothetical protein